MKNVVNIFLFYFVTAILNVWAEQGIIPEIYWAATTEIIEAEEREREEHFEVHKLVYNKVIKKGAGSSDIDENIAFESITQSIFASYFALIPLFCYSGYDTLKQYQNKLINSLYIHKLYMLFRCPKAFLC